MYSGPVDPIKANSIGRENAQTCCPAFQSGVPVEVTIAFTEREREREVGGNKKMNGQRSEERKKDIFGLSCLFYRVLHIYHHILEKHFELFGFCQMGTKTNHLGELFRTLQTFHC